MMFQDARLLPWKSVIDNVGLGLKGQWRDAARRALAAVGRRIARGMACPHFLVGRNSEWRWQERSIDRDYCCLMNARALDALTRLEMQDLIGHLAGARLYRTVGDTHDVSEAVAMADRALLIEEGKLVWI